jgi:hypothetical protein
LHGVFYILGALNAEFFQMMNIQGTISALIFYGICTFVDLKFGI